MPILHGLRESGESKSSKLPYYFVDNPFDYRGMVSGDAPVATFTNPPSVAIIGCGAAGLVAGYELLRAGGNVTLFENLDRVGGRCYSMTSDKLPDTVFAEMGAMRVPLSSQLFYHYADLFGVRYDNSFPNPGKVDTVLSFKGDSQLWKAGDPVPQTFQKVHDGWSSLVDNESHELSVNGNKFMSPGYLGFVLSSGDLEQVKKVVVPQWQRYIDYFKYKSFFEALTEIFTTNADTPPGGKKWDFPGDYEIFGALGIGSGGFEPLFEEGFLEMLRILLNGLELDQQFIVDGISSLATGFAEQELRKPSGETDKLANHIRLQAQVVDLKWKSPSWEITILDKAGKESTHGFDYVISSISSRALQVMFAPMDSDWREALGQAVSAAVCRLHMISSSKIFVPTSNTNWPVGNIQSDSLLRNLYNLKYPNDKDIGMVLMSYTWEDDSRMFPGLGPNPQNKKHQHRRLDRVMQDINAVWPPMGEFLQDNMIDDISFLDWVAQYGFFGAFKLNHPGQDTFVHKGFYQFQQCKEESDPKLYLAGDSFSWNGGWIEGALQSGLNAATAVMHGAGLRPEKSPVTDLDPNLYKYD